MPASEYKRCPKCEESKDVADFYRNRARHDGLSSYCKSCMNQSSAKWRKNNPDRQAEIEKRYEQAHPGRRREISERYAERHPEGRLEAGRRYVKRHPDRIAARVKRERKANPKIFKARKALTGAVERGAVLKPTSCEDCERELEARLIHGHHADYSRPLDVEWLCARCHATRHPR